MKVTGLDTYLVYAAPTRASSNPRSRIWLFVEVHTDEGITGIGEGGGWSFIAEKALQELKPFLIGEDPFNTEKLWYRLSSAQMGWGHFPTGALQGGVLAAVDIALWDIKGKALGKPVYALLGGQFRDRIQVYGHADTPERAQELIERGYTAFKCSMDAGDVNVIKGLRDAVGYDVRIGLHAHGNFTPSEAIQVAKRCERYEPMFFEEPVPSENVDDLAKVAAATSIPIATGERLFNKWCFTPLLSCGIVDIVQPEVLCLGGITEEKKLAAMAESHYVSVAPHDGSSGPVQEMANLHLCASIPNFFLLEHSADDVPWRHKVVTGASLEKDGYIQVPDRPGLGIELNREEIARHPVPSHEEMTYTARNMHAGLNL